MRTFINFRIVVLAVVVTFVGCDNASVSESNMPIPTPAKKPTPAPPTHETPSPKAPAPSHEVPHSRHKPSQLSNRALINELDGVIFDGRTSYKAKSVARFVKRVAENFAIAYQLKVGDREFFFTKPICRDGSSYAYAIAFTKFNAADQHENKCSLSAGTWVARVFYRSQSNGVWRGTAGFKDNIYSKGQHYTQDFRPQRAIEELLESTDMALCISKPNDPIKTYFPVNSFVDLSVAFPPLPDEVLGSTCTDIPSKLVTVPFEGDFFSNQLRFGYGLMYSRNSFLIGAKKTMLPGNFFPQNLSVPESSYETTHSMFSLKRDSRDPQNISFEKNITAEVYLGRFQNRVVEWHWAFVKGSQKPWISRIRFRDSEASSYGCDKEIIDSESLPMKPFEYHTQLNNIYHNNAPEDINNYGELFYHGHYVDIRNWLAKWPLIKEFISAHRW